MIQSLESIQCAIYDFLETANGALEAKDRMFYGGHFLTGRIEQPKFLFLGINPGFGANDWPQRPLSIPRNSFSPIPCKFVDEHKDGARLAQKIVDVALQGYADKLETCAESSLRSFFATPDEPTLNGQLAALAAKDLHKEHDRLMTDAVKTIVETTNPKHIVCIGMTAFKRFMNVFGGNPADVKMKSAKSASGKSDPVYYKHTMINDRPVHGLLHLSGGHPSKVMIEDLKKIFSALG
ncbi:hypothetical protein JCM17960_08640 [Magnetospira thiophila]